jgi:hypothetical protein
MRQSLQIPMHIKSENRIRGVRPMAIFGQHDAQRKKVDQLLTKHIVKPPDIVRGDMNRFVVTLCRISAGFLDKEDNLRGAFKHVKDSVARWLGFRNDEADWLSWRFQQQECPLKWHAIRITIDDDTEGEERVIVVGDSPAWLGEIIEGSNRKRGRARDEWAARVERGAGQAALTFRRVFIAYPWDLPDGAADDDIIATELREYGAVERPPEQIQVRIPAQHVDRMLRRFGTGVRGLGPGTGPRLVFERHEHEDAAMGGLCWLYMPVEYDEAAKA